MKRYTSFALGEIYHICNKSISNYKIFRKEEYSRRFLDICSFYNLEEKYKYSDYLRKEKTSLFPNLLQLSSPKYTVLSYCLMPDHYHILIQASKDTNISKYIGTIENSYTRFYNLRNNRKGPLWQSSFRCVRIQSNEQLLHVIRYIHLNPVTANLATNPRDWEFSSHALYLQHTILNSIPYISIKSVENFEAFVLNNADYQKRLRVIKSALRDY